VIKLVFCLRRRQGLSVEAFREYWRDHHGPLVARHADALRIVEYTQLAPLGVEINESLRASRGAPPAYDGIAEVWYENIDAISEAATSEQGRAALNELLEDERRFLDHPASPLLLGSERRVVGGSPPS
jgi:uncharacterized protein (TIGR02118 family)